MPKHGKAEHGTPAEPRKNPGTVGEQWGTSEHQWGTLEHQGNTSRIPRNKGTIQNEEQLR